MQRRINMFILAVLVLGILAACGGSGSAPSTSSEASSSGDAAPSASAGGSAEESAPASASASGSAGGSGAAASGDIRTSKSGYQGVINYWVLGYTPGNQFAIPMERAVEAFEKANPDINVEITGYPPNDEGFTKLTTAVQGGQGVDVLRLPSDRLPAYVEDDLIAPIDEFLTEADTQDIYPNVLDRVRLRDGQAYAWPLWVVPMGMYVNLDVLQEKNIAPPPKDWTWEQFVETAKQLTFTRADGTQVYGFSGFIDPGVVNTWGLWMNQDPSVRPVADDNTFGFDTPEAAAGMQRFADLALVHKVTPPDFGAQKDSDVKGGFVNKQIAMIVDATGPSAQFKADGVNFDIWPMPSYNGNRLTVGAIGLIAVTQQEDQAKLQASMDLARYLTSAEVQTDVAPSTETPTGFYLAPGARQSVTVADPLDKFVPFVDEMWVTPVTREWPQITRLIHPAYQNIVFGQVKPEEAMQQVAPEVDQLLSESAQ